MPSATWGIGGHANDRNCRLWRAAHPLQKRLRPGGEGNDSVHACLECRPERLFFAFSQARIGAEFQLHILDGKRMSFVGNARPHLVPERRGALESIYGDAETAIRF